MHIQIPCPYENNVTNTTSKSLPLRFSPSLPFLLLAQPWPPFFFLKQKQSYIGSNLKQKQSIHLFTIWKIQSEKIHLDSFLLWFLLMWSLCLPSANWHLCEQHRAATDRTTTSGRPDSPECFSLSIFFGKSNQQAPLVWLSHSSLKFIYSLLIDLINCWLIIVIYHFDLLIDFHIISIYWLIYIVIDYCDDYFDWFAWHFLG